MSDLATETEPLANLAGAMAHELNNIFTAVAGNLSLLDTEIEDPNHQAVIVRDIVRAANRGIALTSRLQAFAGRQALLLKKVELNEVLSRTLKSVAVPKGVVLHLKPAAARTTILADECKLGEVIEELVFNSCAAIPAGGGNITVETAIRSDGAWPYVWLCIQDDGSGMEPGVARQAAIPLFTTARQNINKGWGLSSCTGMIRQLHGRITLSSRPNEGTRIEILIPQA